MKQFKALVPIIFGLYGLEITTQLKAVVGKNATPEELATALYKAGVKMRTVLNYFMDKISELPEFIQMVAAEDILENSFMMLNKEAMFNHKCDNPNCGVERLKNLLYPEHGHIVIEDETDQKQFDAIIRVLSGKEEETETQTQTENG